MIVRPKPQYWSPLYRGISDLDVESTIHPSARPSAIELIDCFRITDRSLRVLGRLTSLTALNLSGTSITSRGLAALSSLKQLHTLVLNSTQVDDRASDPLSALPALETLALNETGVTDRFADRIAAGNLNSLGLENTDVSSKLLATLAGVDWHRLGLRSTGVACLSALRNAVNLRSLDVAYTPIGDSELLSLASGLLAIDDLHIAGTAVSTSGLTAIAQTSCVRLDISGILLEPRAGQALGTMPRLVALRATNSQIGHASARALSRSMSLERLDLRRNELDDDAVRQFVDMPALQFLDIRGNSVSQESLRILTRSVTLRVVAVNSPGISDADLRVASAGRVLFLRHIGFLERMPYSAEYIGELRRLAGW